MNEKFYESLKAGNLTSQMRLLEKISKNTSKSEFETFMSTKELPALKLTSKEMELLSGGIFWWLLDFLLSPANGDQGPKQGIPLPPQEVGGGKFTY